MIIKANRKASLSPMKMQRPFENIGKQRLKHLACGVRHFYRQLAKLVSFDHSAIKVDDDRLAKAIH